MTDRYAMDWTSLSLGDDETAMTRGTYVGPEAPPPPLTSLPNALMRSFTYSDTRDRSWMTDAACRGLTDGRFFCDPTDEEQLESAVKVCEGCPMLEECRGYADGLDASGRKVAPRESDGVWAGKWRGRKSKQFGDRDCVCSECSKAFTIPHPKGPCPKTCSAKCARVRRNRQQAESARRKKAA